MTRATRSIPYAYLTRQFADRRAILDDIDALAARGDFTLGRAVADFEARVAAYAGLPHAVGMASGTDALTLALRALGIGHGDEVITATNSFVASAGAIVAAGATPVLADVLDDFTLDPDDAAKRITPRTKAILPVHLTGTIADMPALVDIARSAGVHLVEDAAQAVGALLDGQAPGSWGEVACYSLHPQKTLNAWGDGGYCLTRFERIDRDLRLLRNHGLEDRDNAVCWGTTGRLAALQAAVATRGLDTLDAAIRKRRAFAAFLILRLRDLDPEVRVPMTRRGCRAVYTTFVLRARRRDELLAHLLDRGIEAKVHYPRPIHLQTVGRNLGYHTGDLPVAERQAGEILTLPCHEYLTEDDLAYMIDAIRGFYGATRDG